MAEDKTVETTREPDRTYKTVSDFVDEVQDALNDELQPPISI